METNILTTEQLFGKEKEEKQPSGSGFGGGWNLSGLIEEQTEKQDIKTTEELFGNENKIQTEEKTTQQQKEPAEEPIISIPLLDEIAIQENNLNLLNQKYEQLDVSIGEEYKLYQDLGKQLDELEPQLQEAPEELQFALSNKYNKILTQHNQLVDKLQKETEQHKSLYAQLDKEAKAYNEKINTYNQLIQAQSEEIKASEPEYIKESDAKDIWDAFKLGASGIWHDTKQYFTSTLPNLIFQDIKDTDRKYIEDKFNLPEGTITDEVMNNVNQKNQAKREVFKEKYIKGEENYNKWLGEHPELVPRPEWEKGVLETVKENPKILFDPAYWGYVAAQTSAFTFGVIGTTLATTAVTGNPLLGAAAGVAAAYPSQAQDLYEELVENGASEEKAAELAAPIGAVIAGVEVIGDLPLLAAVSKPFKKALTKNITNTVAKNVIKSGIATFAKVEASETLEEVVQGAIQDATVNTVRENKSLLKDIPETVVQTLIATAPLALIGAGGDVKSSIDINNRLKENIVKANLNAIKKEIDNTLEKPDMPETEIKTETPVETPKTEPKKPDIEIPETPETKVTKQEETEIPEVPKTEPKLPEILVPQRDTINKKIDEIIERELPKVKVKFPDITAPEIREQIIPKVEEEINKIIPKADAKAPDIDIPEKEILAKVEQVVKEELPNLKVKPKAPEIPEIPKLTNKEREMLGSSVEEEMDEGNAISHLSPNVMSEKSQESLREKGYLEEDKFVLTEEGKKAANAIKQRVEAEKAGIPLELREKPRVITDKQLVKTTPGGNGFLTGQIDGKDFYTNSHFMLKGKPDAEINKEIKPDLEKIAQTKADQSYKKIEPVFYTDPHESYSTTEEADAKNIWFDNKAAIQARYYDYIKKKYPDAEFRGTNDRDNIIRIYDSKDEFIGLIMPIRKDGELPKNMSEDKTAPTTSQSSEAPEALYAKNWQVEMGKEPETDKRINKTQIVNWAESSFGFPIKGKVTHKWKAAGTFYPRQQIVRMGKWGELSVMVHEISHGVDDQLEKSLGEDWKRPNRVITSELADLDYDPKKRRTSEGFAEFMRYKMTTDKAEALAPNFNKYFDDILAKMPDLKKKFDNLKEKMDTWNKQGAENRIIQHIDWKGEHTNRGLSSKAKKALEWVNVRFNDEFYYPRKITKEIEKALGKELPPTKNPALMMEYSKSKAGSIARTFVMEKAVDEYGNVVGDGLIDVLKPIPNKEMKQFISYAVAKRAMYLEARKIESGFDIEDAKYIIEKYKDKGWDSTVKELTKWSNHMLDWLVNAGALDKKSTEIMRALNPVYLPFKRAFFEDVNVTKGVGGYVDTGKGIKSIKGSGRPIINPLESMISQTTEMIAKAQKIRIAKVFIELAEEKGLGGFITKVPAPMKATTFNANQIKSYLDEIASSEEGMMSSNNYDELLTVFTQDFKYNGKDNIVSMWRNGKQEFYEIHPDLYEAFNGIDPLKLGPIGKVFAPFARMLRLGATELKFSFGFARNPFRDALSYAVFSKRKNATVFDPIKGYYKDIVCKPGELTWRFKAMGGGLSGQIGFDRASVQNTYDEMLDKKLGKIGKVLQVVKHPVNTLADIISITEMGPRSAEIEASYKKYTSEKWLKDHPNWTEEDAYVQAFLDAQDVTVNFTKSGKWAKQLNQVVAFFNVAIRGPEKLYRSFRERPIQTMVKGIAWLALPAILSWHRNKDKDWYKNLPPAYKYNNMWFEIGENVYRLPIPFELGMVFMSAPQAFLDTYQGKDDQAIKGLMELGKAQIPIPMPSALAPVYEVAKNKNWLGNPIESPGMQYLYPTERKRDYTSKLAVALSKGADEIGIKLSPIQIDYLIDGYSGGFLKQFRISGEQLADYPVIGDLVLRNPGYPNKQLNNFFSDYELLSQKRASNIANRDELQKYARIKGFYDYYKTMIDRIKKAEERKNTKLVKTYYKQMTDRLARYGYK